MIKVLVELPLIGKFTIRVRTLVRLLAYSNIRPNAACLKGVRILFYE